MQNQTSGSDYDAIVVGAGLAGLAAGALLAKAGKQVLVVEQEEHPGGFIREFRYGPYKINPAIHSIFGCNSGGQLGQGIIDAVLEHLGVQDQCQFINLISISRFYRHFPKNNSFFGFTVSYNNDFTYLHIPDAVGYCTV